MVIGGYTFVHVCNIEAMRSSDGDVLTLLPQNRYEKRHTYPLNRYGAGPFCKFKIPTTYTNPGVYALTVGDEIRYIGETNNLSRRYNMGYGNISPKNCYKGGQETNVRLNNLILQAALKDEALSLWFHETAEYKAVEVELRLAYRTLWNRV
ncbi:hypothetical protein [Mesorhizobium sp. B2-1-3A]|uniref:hypothetical protein n=1 Tax=Mesorhizobium sp. B2-1-3A TaxID=2589971 RepID=UPI0011293750|nr:hypothetical protein [Mesorhizobium sp. B2-1-3A]TPM99524.1 hypothetical protein FJ977_08990 [Mesorhizobium sp. B2-1-3A]